MAVIAVLVGFRGVVSVREQNDFYVSVRECVQQLPKPVFIDDRIPIFAVDESKQN